MALEVEVSITIHGEPAGRIVIEEAIQWPDDAADAVDRLVEAAVARAKAAINPSGGSNLKEFVRRVGAEKQHAR